MLSLSIALGWYTVDLVLVISTLGTILPVADNFLPLTLGKLLLVALTVSTVLRFPLLLDLRVGAPYHSVSSILANEWQPIYNWANISILRLSLCHFLATYALHPSVFTAAQSATDCCYRWFCSGNTQGAFSMILPRPLRGIVCVTLLLLGQCWMS